MKKKKIYKKKVHFTLLLPCRLNSSTSTDYPSTENTRIEHHVLSNIKTFACKAISRGIHAKGRVGRREIARATTARTVDSIVSVSKAESKSNASHRIADPF